MRVSAVDTHFSGWSECVRPHLKASNDGRVGEVDGGASVLPGTVHTINQGEGGEQGGSVFAP